MKDQSSIELVESSHAVVPLGNRGMTAIERAKGEVITSPELLKGYAVFYEELRREMISAFERGVQFLIDNPVIQEKYLPKFWLERRLGTLKNTERYPEHYPPLLIMNLQTEEDVFSNAEAASRHNPLRNLCHGQPHLRLLAGHCLVADRRFGLGMTEAVFGEFPLESLERIDPNKSLPKNRFGNLPEVVTDPENGLKCKVMFFTHGTYLIKKNPDSGELEAWSFPFLDVKYFFENEVPEIKEQIRKAKMKRISD